MLFSTKAALKATIVLGSVAGSLAVALVGASPASAATADIVKNGSFELPTLQGNDYAYFASIPNWVRADDSAPFEIQRGTVGPASVGSQYLEVDSDSSGPGGAYQNVVAKGTQRAYTLTVVYAARPGTDATENQIKVGVFGASETTLTADGTADNTPQWTSVSINVTLPGKNASVFYADASSKNADGVGMLIDSISLTPTAA